MTAQAYYKIHSPVTDPGVYSALYDGLPDDIENISAAVRGLLVHYGGIGYQAPIDRIGEVDTRLVAAMLQRIVELDDRPLGQTRPFHKRLVGCCRDYAVLTVSILRHKGVPARVRYGAAVYFVPGYFMDHAILEYWNGERWVSVDAELDPYLIQHHKIGFDPFDVPDDQFIRGGRAWLMCREEGFDPLLFGLGPDSDLRGWSEIVVEMRNDLAALNRMEMLCWDVWGIESPYETGNEDDKLLLDEVARATLDNTRFAQWQSLFQHDKLRLPKTIASFSPAAPPEQLPITVQLDF